MAKYVHWTLRRFRSSNLFQRLSFENGSASISTSCRTFRSFQIEISSLIEEEMVRFINGFLFSVFQNATSPNETIVMVAVRFTYVLKDFESMTSRQTLPKDEIGNPILTELPFGSFFDPVRSEKEKRL